VTSRLLRARVAAAAAALAMATSLVQPAAVARAGLDDSFDPSCPASSGLPQAQRAFVQFTGSLTCFRPGAPRFGGTASRADEQRRLNNPNPGDPCMNISYHPVTFAEADQGLIHANFQTGGGGNASIALSSDEAVQAATYEAIVGQAQVGTYQPSVPTDPNSTLACQLQPGFHAYCPTAGTPLDTFCYIWVLHAITPATSAPPDIGPYLAAIADSIRGDAGKIASAPSQKGVVNTPVCFWVDGMGIPVERDMTLTLPGAPDASGRRIFYTYLARVRFLGVDWDFNDPFGNAPAQPAPACGDHPQITAHRYRQISDDVNPDRDYHVTAQERYSITADVFWVDSNGAEHQTVDTGGLAPVIAPPAYPQYVGQVEGVPVGG
jgi:hypothetical protein